MDTKKPSVIIELEYTFKMQTSSLFVDLNIWFNVVDTIYHQPTLIFLQSHGDNKKGFLMTLVATPQVMKTNSIIMPL